MSKWIWGVLIALNATQASALSCLFGNTASAWQDAHSQKEPFVTVRGTFQLPQAGLMFEEEGYTLPATFTGVIMHADGSTTPIYEALSVEGICINGDCGYVGPGHEVITFLHGNEGDRIAYSMPCSAYPMGTTDAVVEELMSCMNGGPCVAGSQY